MISLYVQANFQITTSNFAMRYIIVLLTLFLLAGCGSETPENLEAEIDQLIAEDQYEEALELIQDADPDETEADLDKLREKTHLNYGIYLEYRTSNPDSMRESMIGALEQFIKVLKINPDNEKAASEIDQIMGIYETIPDRDPGEDILEELRELGFDY